MEYIEVARKALGSYHAARTVHRHRHRFVIFLAFAIPLLTYALSISHDVASRDLADAQGVAYLLGIPHPTGYPLFVLLGWLFTHAITFGTIAYRMNLFGALCMSFTCLVGVITALRVGAGPVTSLGAFLCFAWARIIWFHGAQADTQDLALLFQAMTLYYLAGWLKHTRTRDIAAAFASWGAALAVHPISLWLLPCVAFAILARVRSLSFSKVALSLLAFVVLLASYAYLPLRSAAIEKHPVDAVQMLAPPAARVYWDTNAPSTQAGFITEVTGAQFGATPLWSSIVNPLNWLGDLRMFYHTVHNAFDIVFVVIAALGALFLLRRQSAICIMLLVAAFSATVTALALSGVEGDPSRYLMLVLWITALFAAAVTVEFTWTVDPRRMFWALILIGNAVHLAIADGGVAATQRAVTSRPLITWVARSVPQDAIVVTAWADATSLAYGAYVDRTLAGRTIVASHPIALASHYASWSLREPVYVLTRWPTSLSDSRFHEVGSPNLNHAIYEFGGSTSPSPPRRGR